MAKLNSKKGTNNNPGKNTAGQEDTKSTHHITYTSNPIPTPYIRQRKYKEKEQEQKKRHQPKT
jgi:hypothetical protein